MAAFNTGSEMYVLNHFTSILLSKLSTLEDVVVINKLAIKFAVN